MTEFCYEKLRCHRVWGIAQPEDALLLGSASQPAGFAGWLPARARRKQPHPSGGEPGHQRRWRSLSARGHEGVKVLDFCADAKALVGSPTGVRVRAVVGKQQDLFELATEGFSAGRPHWSGCRD